MKWFIVLFLLISGGACRTAPTEPVTSSLEATDSLTLPEEGGSTTTATVSPTTLPRPTQAPAITPEEIIKNSPDEAREPVVIFRQEGGFAGVDLTWSIYANGLIVTPQGEELSVAPAVVDELLEMITNSGFFDIVQPKTDNICCDFFVITLTANNGEMRNIITFTDGDPNMPDNLSDAVSAVQMVITSLPE